MPSKLVVAIAVVLCSVSADRNRPVQICRLEICPDLKRPRSS